MAQSAVAQSPREALLAKVQSAQQELLQFLPMLARYGEDRRIMKAGYTIRLAIDFSELFRYFYPDLDRTLLQNPNRFLLEQTAIRYALSENHPTPLLVLRPYYEEFKHHFEHLKQRLLLEISHLAAVHPEALPSQRRRAAEGKPARAAYPYLELLAAEQRDKRVGESIALFRQLVEGGRIQSEYNVLNVPADYEALTLDTRFLAILNELEVARPGRHPSNAIDAKAALWIQKLNQTNASDKRVVYLVSSARLVWRELARLTSEVVLDGFSEAISIWRNPYYPLLTYYFQSAADPDVLTQVQSLTDECERGLTGLHSIIEYLDSLDADDVLPSDWLTQANRLADSANLTLRGLADGLDSYSPGCFDPNAIEAIVSRVEELVRDPSALRAAMNTAVQDLRSAGSRLDEVGRLLRLDTSEVAPDARPVAADFRCLEPKTAEVCRGILGKLGSGRAEDLVSGLLDAAALLARDPQGADSQVLAARVMLRADDLSGAEEFIRTAQLLAPDHPELSFTLALLEKKRGNLDRALEWLDRAVAATPDHPKAWRERAFVAWLKSEGTEDPQVRQRLVNEAIHSGERALEALSRESVERPWYLNDLAYYFAESRRGAESLARAENMAREAIALHQEHTGADRAEMLDSLGYILLLKAELDEDHRTALVREAVQLFLRALECPGDQRYAKLHLHKALSDFAAYGEATAK